MVSIPKYCEIFKKKKKKKKKTELKTFFGNNVSKVCLKQLKLSDHIKLDK